MEEDTCYLCKGEFEVPVLEFDDAGELPPGGVWVDSGETEPCPFCCTEDETVDKFS